MTKLLVIAVFLAACGGSSSSPGDDDSVDAGVDAAPPQQQPLTCSSVALCTTYDVKTFLGTVPAPAGGTIRSGLYRLAWVLDPDDVNETGGYHEDLEALLIQGTSMHRAGFFDDDVGTLSTSGTTLTFKVTEECALGTDESAGTTTLTFPYTATDTQLQLYSHVSRSDGVQWDRLYTYVRADDPSEICRTVASAPSTPGDSAKCNVTNCECHFAMGQTLEQCY